MVLHTNAPDRYQNAQIYKLSNTDFDDVYIGSTNYAHLSKRYWRHRRDGNDERFKHRYGRIFETANHKIECLEKYPCNNKEELRMRERYWMDQHPNHINTTMPILTAEEKKKIASDNQKKWYATDDGKAKKKISNDRFRSKNPNYYQNKYQLNKNKDHLMEMTTPEGCKGITLSIKFE
jgi:hypothetical protein